jgi:outer membrane protein assembly factor BamB
VNIRRILFALFLIGMLTTTFYARLFNVNASSSEKSVQAESVDWWSMFHHDLNHMGYSTSTAPKTNRTLWSYTTGSYVESSPAVVGGVVFVGSWDSKVYALNASSGALIWSYKTGGYLYSSPAVAGGVVYVGSNDDKVYALNATTGKLVWKYPTGGVVESSPVVVGGVVYVGSWDSYVYALDAAKGTLVWRYLTGGPIVHSSPAVVGGGVVYIGSTDDKVYALDAAKGTPVWSYTTGSVVDSSPVVVGGVVYVGSWDDKVYAIGLSPSPDVAVTGVMSSKTVVGQNFSMSISVTVANQDNRAETFKVTAYANGANATFIASQNVTLSSGLSAIITFVWDTTGFAKGNYTISAYAWPVQGETYTADNNCTGGTVYVVIPGDINGDGAVGPLDLGIMGAAWGAFTEESNYNANADINDDDSVGPLDLGIIGAHWGEFET